MYFANFFKHLKKVLIHKIYVAHYCFMCRLYLQGLLHDMSKFSFTEFFESVKYYQGNISPIDACKKDKGYSLAWFHHRGRNKHHWEYWVDDFQDGMVPKKMPFKYALEMVCDYLGAGKAYSGKKFTIQQEWAWWQTKRGLAVMHPDTFAFADFMFNEMNEKGIKNVLGNRKVMKEIKAFYSMTPEQRKERDVHLKNTLKSELGIDLDG